MFLQSVGLPHAAVTVDCKPVVLADEQHRDPHQSGKVEALVIDALFGGAVAEHRYGNLRHVTPLEGESRTDGMWNRTGDDGGRAHEAHLRCRKVHGPGFPLGPATHPSIELGKHRIEAAALGDVKPV